MFSVLYSKVKDNVKLVKDNVDYIKYNIEKQPLVERLKDVTRFDLIEENANYIKNQTLEQYFSIIDQIFDVDVMNELMKSDKLNTVEDKLELLNNMRVCLVNLLRTTLMKNLNELIRVIATYINLIDSTIVKLDLAEDVDFSHLRFMIKDILKFVQKFIFVFDENDYKCENLNIF